MFSTARRVDYPFEENGSHVVDHVERRATLCYLIHCACEEIAQNSKNSQDSPFAHIRTSHHVGDTTFFDSQASKSFNSDDVKELTTLIKSYISGEEKIAFFDVPKSQLVNYFTKKGRMDKAKIAERIKQTNDKETEVDSDSDDSSDDELENSKKEDVVLCASFHNYVDYVFEPMKGDLTDLGVFTITAKDGFIRLQVNSPVSNSIVDGLCPEKVHNYITGSIKRLQKNFGIHNIIDWNNFITGKDKQNKTFEEVKQISDSYSSKMLDDIESQIIAGFPERRIISIAGPSACGKSTVSKPIKKRLESRGFDCIVISTDDYFMDRCDMIPNAEGKLEFEKIDCVLCSLLGQRLKKLLEGQQIPVRSFDFRTGTGTDSTTEFMQLNQNGFIIVEGIHCLNPDLLKHIGNQPQTIYVSPLTPVSIDREHIISMSDNCLARRCIRDNEERGFSARLNIIWWDDVREGEERNICPFIKNADMIYDSSYLFEFQGLQKFGTELFKHSFKGTNESTKEANFKNMEITRLLKYFSIIDPVRTN